MTGRRVTMLLLSTAFFMTVLDSTSVLAALPDIRGTLGTGPLVQWAVTGYVLAAGGLLMAGGRLADRFGRRRAFLAGTALFALTSLACGLAPTAGLLAGGRAVQGAAAALITPAALALVQDAFPTGDERERAMGVLGALGGVGATTGLLAGGLLTEVVGWRWIFLINVPISAAVLTLAPSRLRESRGPLNEPFDAVGALLGAVAVTLLVATIVQGPTLGVLDLVPAVATVATGCAVIWRERTGVGLLVPPALRRVRAVVGGNLAILCAGMAVDGMLVTLTSYVQQLLGWSPVRFGLLAAVMTIASVAGPALARRCAARRTAGVIGGALIAVAAALLTRMHDSAAVGTIVIALIVFGIGLGALFFAAQVSAVSGPSAHAGVASGMVETSFTLGSAVGVGICTTLTSADAGVTGARWAFASVVVFGALAAVIAARSFDRQRQPETSAQLP